jgi:hypothetical protein
MTAPRNRGLPPGIAGAIHSAPADRPKRVYTPEPEPVEDLPGPAPAPLPPAKKVGRPKGPTRTKKTVYFHHPENIEKIKKALALHADLWIDEESEIVDLALAVVAQMVSDASEIRTIKSVYEAEIKPASQK